MPSTSKDRAPDIEEGGPATAHSAELGEYTVNFVSIHEGHSMVELLKGLPGDMCPCPHWGYLIEGEMTVSYGDRDEVFRAGDAFYMAPGHVPSAVTGSEFVQFSPTLQMVEVYAAIKSNVQRLMQGA